MATPENAFGAGSFGPGGAGAPFWGLNDKGLSCNEAPLFATDPWDIFYIGTRKVPGICKVSPGSIARIEINRKKGKGMDGARLTATGYDPREFQVTVEIATVDQWNELQDIVDQYWRIPGKTSNLSEIAVSVYHPNLQWLKVYSAVLVGISPLVDGSIEGAKATTFHFQESVPPKPKNQTKSNKGASVSVVPQFRKGQAPQNATPPAPSSNRKNASLTGPPPTPPGGTS